MLYCAAAGTSIIIDVLGAWYYMLVFSTNHWTCAHPPPQLLRQALPETCKVELFKRIPQGDDWSEDEMSDGEN